MSKFDTVSQRLKDLGFTIYEAKAYVSLLEHHPVTRYELSRNSGVPRSAIYSVIHRLEELGAVSAQSSEPEKYMPLMPDKLFELLSRQFEHRIQAAKKYLQDFEVQIVPDQLWNIVGYDNLILKAKELIQKAREAIYLSIWHREYLLLQKDIARAKKRGVRIFIYSFTELPAEAGLEFFCYDLSEKELEKIWAHKIILIIDKEEVLMGEADNLQKKKTVWTTNRALIDIAMNHIILDITMFGIRLRRDVSSCVRTMQNGETAYLGKLLSKKHPKVKY